MMQMTILVTQQTAGVVAGVISVASMTAKVQGWTGQITAQMTQANAAIVALQAALPALNMNLAVGSMHLSSDPNLQELGTLLGSASLQIASLQSEMTAIITLSPAELAAAASFPDASADQPGATGGA